MKEYKNNKKYKCPYCNERLFRGDLVNHISEDHEEMIPEESTAAKVAFDYLNPNKPHVCRSCGKQTNWNEDKWRYDDIHPDPACIKIARQKALKNHTKKYGVSTLLNNADHQAKMLNNRSISGTYTFIDGESLTYVGSYENKFLEFCDNILHFKANIDIFNIDGKDPEYVIEYIYKGNKHFWIPDYYIKPFNLMVDLKDGGDNKNNREMTEYREKQVEKEKAIEKQGKFNYLRLTDNQFGQLLEIFLDIKYSLESPKDQKKIHIHEYAGCTCGGHPQDPSDHIYAVSYSDSGYITDGYGIITDKLSDNIFIDNNGKIERVNNKEFLKEKKFSISKITIDNIDDVLNTLEEMCINETSCDSFFIYDIIKNINGKVIFESNGNSFLQDCINENVLYSYECNFNRDIIHEGLPIINYKDREKVSSILEGYYNIDIKTDINGYFVENMINKNRSMSVKSIDDIQIFMLDLLESTF